MVDYPNCGFSARLVVPLMWWSGIPSFPFSQHPKQGLRNDHSHFSLGTLCMAKRLLFPEYSRYHQQISSMIAMLVSLNGH